VSDLVPLPAVSRIHLDRISDATGIFQHAIHSVPDPAHGYCTDDVARALQVDLLHARVLGWPAVSEQAWRSLRFLGEAFDTGAGRFRNFRGVDRAWIGGVGSEDCQGRAMHALGDATAAPDPAFAAQATAIFERALPGMRGLRATRAVASLVLGCDAASRAGAGREAGGAFETFADRLAARFGLAAERADWPWPENVVTYENGLPVRALLVAAHARGDRPMLDVAIRVLDWLVDAQTAAAGHCSPVGNGWWTRGGTPAAFDQQPIEPVSFLLAAEAAHAATGDERHVATMEWAFAWFAGGNDLGIRVADPARGASFDGLTPLGVNRNEGAESTLVWLSAVEHLRAVRATRVARATAPRHQADDRLLAGVSA
jgi:hypothetical protein